MNEQRIDALLSAACDDLLTAEEQRELDRLLAPSPEARRLRAQMRDMDSMLQQSRPLAPPAALHGRIVSSIRLPEPRAARARFTWLPTLATGPAVRYGMAAAAGLLLGGLFLDLPRELPRDSALQDLVGTVAPLRDPAPGKVIDAVEFRRSGQSAVARLERRDGRLLLEVELDTNRALAVSIDLGAAGVAPGALAQLDEPFESLAYSDRRLELRGSGRRRITVVLRPGARPAAGEPGDIRIRFSSNGALLQEGSLQPAWE